MGINNLPGPGIKFRAKIFSKKLRTEARKSLKNFDIDNQKAIGDSVGLPLVQRAIRRGGLSKSQQLNVRRKIQVSDKTLTVVDKRKIKEILNHLGRGAAAKGKAVPEGFKEVKTADGKSHMVEKNIRLVKKSDGTGFLTQEQIQKNLNRNKFDRISQNKSEEGGGAFTQTYAGGTVVKSYGIRGSKEDLGIKKIQTGFAGGYKSDKLPEAPATKTPPLGGTRPIGL